MIPALEPDPESDFKPFDDSGSGLDPVKTGIVTNLQGVPQLVPQL